MKILCLIVSFLAASISYGNEIDRLLTNADVSNFLVKRISRKFKDFPLISETAGAADSNRFGHNRFFKIDADNDGRTDLLIDGSKLLIILDKGKEDYQVRLLDRGPYQPQGARLVSIDSAASPRRIILQQTAASGVRLDTLVYAFNNFIEYNPHPMEQMNLERIAFRSGPCKGECPVFQMMIDNQKRVMYKAILYNDQTGTFTSTLPAKDYEELLQLLKYLQIDNLPAEYAVSASDAQTGITEISYNGKFKTIHDHGQMGTYGLSLLYLKFMRWRTSLDWTDTRNIF